MARRAGWGVWGVEEDILLVRIREIGLLVTDVLLGRYGLEAKMCS